METTPLYAYLVDDEPLAIERLERLLAGFDGLRITGSTTDPAKALDYLNSEAVDVLFLDIQMPGMNGFELLSRLNEQPFVIFTTAYDEYALRAFQVNSIDYLMKPIEPEQLARAIKKLDWLRPVKKPDWQRNPDLPVLLKELAASLRGERPDYPRRIASRIGERISFLDLDAVTHFVAQDKLTYAIVNGHRHCVDQTHRRTRAPTRPRPVPAHPPLSAGQCGLDSRGELLVRRQVYTLAEGPAAHTTARRA